MFLYSSSVCPLYISLPLSSSQGGFLPVALCHKHQLPARKRQQRGGWTWLHEHYYHLHAWPYRCRPQKQIIHFPHRETARESEEARMLTRHSGWWDHCTTGQTWDTEHLKRHIRPQKQTRKLDKLFIEIRGFKRRQSAACCGKVFTSKTSLKANPFVLT